MLFFVPCWGRACSISGSLTFCMIFAKVPTKPPSNVEEVRNQYDQTLVQRLEEVKPHPVVFITQLTAYMQWKLFQTRPIWTRAALLNQFTPAQARDIHKYVTCVTTMRYFVPSCACER